MGSSVLLKDEQSSILAKGNNFGIRPSAENFRLKRNNLNKNYMGVEAELLIEQYYALMEITISEN